MSQCQTKNVDEDWEMVSAPPQNELSEIEVDIGAGIGWIIYFLSINHHDINARNSNSTAFLVSSQVIIERCASLNCRLVS